MAIYGLRRMQISAIRNKENIVFRKKEAKIGWKSDKKERKKERKTDRSTSNKKRKKGRRTEA